MEKKASLILSASRKKTYEQCPRRYYYQYIERLPRQEWDHFTLGTLVHGVLERFHIVFKECSQKLNLKKLMKESFLAQRKEMESNQIISSQILLDARDILSNYLNKIERDGLGSKYIIATEDEFTLPLNEDFALSGVVDRLDMDDDGILHIKDYKTNKDHKYMEPTQLQIYGLYLEQKYPGTDRFRGSYIMLKMDSMLLSYDFNMEDVKKEKSSLIKCAEKIMEEERWITRPSKLCDFCDFKQVCLNNW